MQAIEKLEWLPIYVKRTFKGYHLIWIAEDWISDKNLLKNLSEILFKQALPHLEVLVKDKKKIENKSPMLAQTRIVSENLFCIKLRDFYTQGEILSILREAIKTNYNKEDTEYIELEDITLEGLDNVFNTCGILKELDTTWQHHSYNQWWLMAHFYGLRYLAGDEKAKEEFLTKSAEYPEYTFEEATKQFNEAVKWIRENAERKEGFLYSCKRYQMECSDEHCKDCKGYPHVYLKVFAGVKVDGLDKQEIVIFNNTLSWLKEFAGDRGYIVYSNLSDIVSIPEQLDNKTCYLTFNTLKEAKEKALELAGILYGKGAVDVRVVVYSKTEGDTLKEVLNNAEDTQERLNLLLIQAVDVFDFAKQELKNSKEIMRKFLQVAVLNEDVLEDLLDILKIKGFKKKEARGVFYDLLEEKKEKEKQQVEAQVRQLFGSEFKLPAGFYLREKELVAENKAITTFFIVDKIYKSIDGKVYGYHIKTINNKEFILHMEDLSKTNIFKVFNENDIPTGDYGSLLINYITAFVRLNEGVIPEEIISNKAGWFKDNYLLPQTVEDVRFAEELQGYGSKGSREEELRLLKEIIEDGNILGVGYLSGISALLIEPLETKNFVIFLSGTAGSGKTTTGAVGLSLFGDYQALMRNMNYTTAGLEILLNKNKDILTVLDELNTSNKDITSQLINTVYNFQNGTGRTRATTKLGLRDTATYRGVLMLTSENDLQQLLEASNTITRGALRRVIQFEFTEKVKREWIERVYSTIREHYGNLIKEIIDYIKTNKETLRDTYKDYVRELNEKYGLKDGIELYTATMLTALEILEKLYGINTATMLATVLNFVKAYQEDIKDEMAITKEKLEEKINQFLYEHMQNFILADIPQTITKSVWGKVDNDCLYITSNGFKHLAKFVKLGEKNLKILLQRFNLAEEGGKRIIKSTSFKVGVYKLDGYKIFIKMKETDTNTTEGEMEIDF
jgi:uncharacterized protein (DUF927 family)